MKKASFSWGNVLKFAGAYVACAIGSGFATGQEVMQFFTGQGVGSIAGSFVTMAVFGWFGGTVMKHGRELQLEKPALIVQYYFGNVVGRVFEILFQVFLYAVFVVMIAGAGATLSEYYGLNPYVGRVGMLLLAFFSVTLSLRKLTDILGSMGVVIIVISVGVGLMAFLRQPQAISTVETVLPTLEMTKNHGGWLWSSILYPGFNSIAVLVFSAGIGSSANSGKEAFAGGMLGGILFGLAVLCMDLGLLANLTRVYDKQVPSLVLASDISPVIGVIFSVVVICGIYTTAVPMLWTVSSQFAQEGTKKFGIVALVLSLLAFVLGLTDFSVLVNSIYPVSGYVGVLLMLVILLRVLFDRRDRASVGRALSTEK